MVIGLTHELTNRMFSNVLTNAQNDVRTGAISPTQYAKAVLDVEAFGVTNQLVVSADLNIPNKGSQSVVNKLKSGTLNRGQVLKIVQKHILNATTKTGKKNAF